MHPRPDDVRLIGGEFTTAELPPDKSWLARYFRSDLTYRYVVYRMTFAQTRSWLSQRKFAQLFIDHTGLYCSFQLLCKTDKKVATLVEALDKAQADKDFAMISKIRLGTYILR